MSYGKVGTGAGIVGGNTGLAVTGFQSLLWAEAALLLVFSGLVLLRIGRMRRR